MALFERVHPSLYSQSDTKTDVPCGVAAGYDFDSPSTFHVFVEIQIVALASIFAENIGIAKLSPSCRTFGLRILMEFYNRGIRSHQPDYLPHRFEVYAPPEFRYPSSNGMRRQYHQRQTDEGLFLWDVHRLVELSRFLPIKDVKVDPILDHEDSYWFQPDQPHATARDIALHAKLIEETDLSYPIILCAEGRIMDGMHRVCKAWIKGHRTISAVQFLETPAPDYINVDPDTLPYDEPW